MKKGRFIYAKDIDKTSFSDGWRASQSNIQFVVNQQNGTDPAGRQGVYRRDHFFQRAADVYSIPGQKHGAHTLEAYFDSTIHGQVIGSNPL